MEAELVRRSAKLEKRERNSYVCIDMKGLLLQGEHGDLGIPLRRTVDRANVLVAR